MIERVDKFELVRPHDDCLHKDFAMKVDVAIEYDYGADELVEKLQPHYDAIVKILTDEIKGGAKDDQ